MYYDKLSSILDQSQLPSSKRLEMTSLGKQLLKFNLFKISGFWVFPMLATTFTKHRRSSVGVMKQTLAKTVTILLTGNWVYTSLNPTVALQQRVYALHLHLMAGYNDEPTVEELAKVIKEKKNGKSTPDIKNEMLDEYSEEDYNNVSKNLTDQMDNVDRGDLIWGHFIAKKMFD